MTMTSEGCSMHNKPRHISPIWARGSSSFAKQIKIELIFDELLCAYVAAAEIK